MQKNPITNHIQILFLFFLCNYMQILSATAQKEPVQPLNCKTSIEFEHLTREKGLPDDFICSGLQDRQGFLWFGTMSGLCRYDGSKFKIYTKENEGLSNNYIWSMYEDRDGQIWIGTEK